MWAVDSEATEETKAKQKIARNSSITFLFIFLQFCRVNLISFFLSLKDRPKIKDRSDLLSEPLRYT